MTTAVRCYVCQDHPSRTTFSPETQVQLRLSYRRILDCQSKIEQGLCILQATREKQEKVRRMREVVTRKRGMLQERKTKLERDRKKTAEFRESMILVLENAIGRSKDLRSFGKMVDSLEQEERELQAKSADMLGQLELEFSGLLRSTEKAFPLSITQFAGEFTMERIVTVDFQTESEHCGWFYEAFDVKKDYFSRTTRDSHIRRPLSPKNVQLATLSPQEQRALCLSQEQRVDYDRDWIKCDIVPGQTSQNTEEHVEEHWCVSAREPDQNKLNQTLMVYCDFQTALSRVLRFALPFRFANHKLIDAGGNAHRLGNLETNVPMLGANSLQLKAWVNRFFQKQRLVADGEKWETEDGLQDLGSLFYDTDVRRQQESIGAKYTRIDDAIMGINGVKCVLLEEYFDM